MRLFDVDNEEKGLLKPLLDAGDVERPQGRIQPLHSAGDGKGPQRKSMLNRISDLPYATLLRVFGPLYWASSGSIQLLQSGNAQRSADLISVYHDGAWCQLPPCMVPLPPRAGIGAFSDDNGQHWNVVCLTLARKPGYPFYLDWRCYSSQTQQWVQMKPLELGWKNMRMENMIVSNDGRNIYLASHYHWDTPYIVSIDMKEQRSAILYLHPNKELHPEEEWMDTDEFAIAKCGHHKKSEKDLCMIRYSSFSKIFSVWVLLYDRQDWIKLDQVRTVDSSFNWPCPVKRFVFLRGSKLLVMAMQDGGLYSYSLQHKCFTKLTPRPVCAFRGLNGVN